MTIETSANKNIGLLIMLDRKLEKMIHEKLMYKAQGMNVEYTVDGPQYTMPHMGSRVVLRYCFDHNSKPAVQINYHACISGNGWDENGYALHHIWSLTIDPNNLEPVADEIIKEMMKVDK